MAVENQLKQKINVFFDAYDETNKAMCLTCADERMYQFLTQDLPKFSEFGEVFVSDAPEAPGPPASPGQCRNPSGYRTSPYVLNLQ